MFASTSDYVSICCLLAGAIITVMEYKFSMGKCMQTRRNHFLFKVHIIVIISACLYLFLRLCTGSIGIVIEHIFSMGRCMLTRRNDFFFKIHVVYRMCLPLHLNMFQFVCLLTGAIGIAMEYMFLHGQVHANS